VLAYLMPALATNLGLYRSHLEVTGLLVKLSPEIAVTDLELLRANPYLTKDRCVIPASAFSRGQAPASPDPRGKT
jgi:hypothetical protein